MIEIMAWIVVALGIVIGVRNLIILGSRRAGAGKTASAARSRAWSMIAVSLLVLATGATGFKVVTSNDVADWIVRSAVLVIVGLMIAFGLRSHLRARRASRDEESDLDCAS